MRALANEDRSAIAVAALHFAYYWCAAASQLHRGECFRRVQPCNPVNASRHVHRSCNRTSAGDSHINHGYMCSCCCCPA